MPAISFYLLGESPSTALLIEVPERIDYENLQHLVASHFAVVHPKGGCPVQVQCDSV